MVIELRIRLPIREALSSSARGDISSYCKGVYVLRCLEKHYSETFLSNTLYPFFQVGVTSHYNPVVNMKPLTHYSMSLYKQLGQETGQVRLIIRTI